MLDENVSHLLNGVKIYLPIMRYVLEVQMTNGQLKAGRLHVG